MKEDIVLKAKKELLKEFVLIYATLKARKLGVLSEPKDTISDGALLFLEEQIKDLAAKHNISLTELV